MQAGMESMDLQIKVWTMNECTCTWPWFCQANPHVMGTLLTQVYMCVLTLVKRWICQGDRIKGNKCNAIVPKRLYSLVYECHLQY